MFSNEEIYTKTRTQAVLYETQDLELSRYIGRILVVQINNVYLGLPNQSISFQLTILDSEGMPKKLKQTKKGFPQELQMVCDICLSL